MVLSSEIIWLSHDTQTTCSHSYAQEEHATAKALFCCKHRQAAVGWSHRAGLQMPGM